VKRRDFLKTSGSFVVVASVGGVGAACGGGGGGDNPDAQTTGVYAFPQGVASGDPLPTAIMLWTRVEAVDGASDDVTVHLQVASDEDFTAIVAEDDLTATSDSDFTLRVFVEGLDSATTYYYRFAAGPGPDFSDVGRTWTAPTATADVAVNLAWVSCMDFEAGFHGAFREMIKDDDAASAANKIHAVVHLGDFIYETRGSQFSRPLSDTFVELDIEDRNGEPRVVAPFPSGGGQSGNDNFANSVDDYRHQYKQYLRDPDLRAARARWPFIHTWDDHEFTNDCWQSQSNYVGADTLDEPTQRRKVAANQAWCEFIPSALSDAIGVAGVANQASDFTAATVTDAPFGTAVDENNLFTEPNNVAALGTMTIYRSLRLGKHCELVITDERSYRSDHAVPEELIYPYLGLYFFDLRNVLSYEMSIAMDAGAEANGGNPPTSFHNDQFPNTNMTRAPGTVLGGPQKAWWKATMQASDATWKVWANEVPLMRFFIKNSGLLIFDRVMDSDAWDGYNYERNELMSFLRDNSIQNVIAITGDIHSTYAGVVMNDHEAATPQPALVELISAGVSSNSQFSFFEYPTRASQYSELRKLVTYAGATEPYVENMNMLLRFGSAAALTMANTDDIAAAQADYDPTINPWLKYADTNAQGYGILRITATGATSDLVTVNRPVVDAPDGPGKKRTAHFTIPLAAPGDDPSIDGPEFTGTPPFPIDPTT
jgi:alkaline phosphatase D